MKTLPDGIQARHCVCLCVCYGRVIHYNLVLPSVSHHPQLLLKEAVLRLNLEKVLQSHQFVVTVRCVYVLLMLFCCYCVYGCWCCVCVVDVVLLLLCVCVVGVVYVLLLV